MLHAAKLISADELPLNSLCSFLISLHLYLYKLCIKLHFIDPEISVVICIMRASLGIAFGSQ